MVLVIATGLWVALALLVPHLPRGWWHGPSIGLLVTAPVLVMLAAQEMGPEVAGLMAVALLVLIRDPRGPTEPRRGPEAAE